MDWSCFYFERAAKAPAQITCGRESTMSGVRLTVDGQKIEVVRMSTAVDKQGFQRDFDGSWSRPRNP
jgi:hypothetical protein